ncbi:hypothetical protein Q5762_33095, partial [Streptomyces sp. P9(2023)]|nr:hypothetical protein [Streptomyces sp. P9(2023)]
MGVVLHAAWFEGDGLHVTDVWETEGHWDRFLAEQLTPAFQELGISGEPEFHIFPLHRRFIGPGVSFLSQPLCRQRCVGGRVDLAVGLV